MKRQAVLLFLAAVLSVIFNSSGLAQNSSLFSLGLEETVLAFGQTSGPNTLCADHSECDSGFCNQGVCANPKVNGLPCGHDRECASSNCLRGICQEAGNDRGDPCLDQSGCGAGLYCDVSGVLRGDVAGYCRIQGGQGDPCKNGSQCTSGNCSSGFCSSIPIGCPFGNQCVTNGRSCQHDSECASGNCDNNICRGSY